MSPVSQGDNGGRELSFIVYDQAAAANGSTIRHHVRSHAARIGWNGRKRTSPNKQESKRKKPNDESLHDAQQEVQNDQCPTRTASDSPMSSPISTLAKLASSSGTPPPALVWESAPSRDDCTQLKRRSPYFATVLNEEHPIWPTVSHAIDPAVYPVSWKPVFSPLLDFCKQCLLSTPFVC